jgi:hypothetical protein
MKIFFAEGLDRILLICPSGPFAAAQMPGFDLPWRQISKRQDELSPSRNPSPFRK